MRRINNVPLFLAPNIGVQNMLSYALRDDVDRKLDPFTITFFEKADATTAMFNAQSITGTTGSQVKRLFVGKVFLHSELTTSGGVRSCVDVEYDEVKS
jgi:hypothetical protein